MYDVVIAGGGLAGLTLALQLKKEKDSLRIAVIERESFPAPTACHKVGESTVEIGAHYLAKTLGLENHLKTEQLPKFGLRFFFGDGRLPLEQRLELGARRYFPTPSYQLDRGIFETFLYEQVCRTGVEVLSNTAVTGVTSDTSCSTVAIRSKNGNNALLPCSWFIDASGRNFFLSRRLQLKYPLEHRAHASWWRVKESLTVSDLAKTPAWGADLQGAYDRRLSTNHLMGPGYWIWLIPLVSGHTSVGIVGADSLVPFKEIATPEAAASFIANKEPRLHSLLSRTTRMDFRVLKSYAHGCSTMFPSENWAITGEAGVFLDPFYSPGSDFIAIANSLITALVTRPGNHSRQFFDRWYASLTRNFLLSYENRYQLWGNPLVMSVKIVWDYAVYWSFVAFFFCQGKITDYKMIAALITPLDRLEKLNASMQNLFSNWGPLEAAYSQPGHVDITNCPYLWHLNESLTAHNSPTEFVEEFHRRAYMLQAAAENICALVRKRHRSLLLPMAPSQNNDCLTIFLKELEDVCNGNKGKVGNSDV